MKHKYPLITSLNVKDYCPQNDIKDTWNGFSTAGFEGKINVIQNKHHENISESSSVLKYK